MASPESLVADLLAAPDDASFDALRRRGLELAQARSGDLWTDYNLHDPGVTILEQVCYALTDLAYRADFDVADLLADEQGRLDYGRLALRVPERIFPSRPTTMGDLRGAILDAVGGAENLWLRRSEREPDGCALPGLYRIVVRPRESIANDAARRQGLLDEVRDAYLAARNLCEDLESVRPVKEIDCVLHARVEVQPHKEPAAVLAAIYHRCERHIAGRARQYPFERARREGRGLEEVFTGPRTEHGYWEEGELDSPARPCAVSDFYALLAALDGVDHVQSLHVEIGAGEARERVDEILTARRPPSGPDSTTDRPDAGRADPDAALRLRVPERAERMHVQLVARGRELPPVSMADFRARYSELETAELAAGRAVQDPSKLYDLPRGEYRDPGRYPSIQHQFPAVYGITSRGLPERTSTNRKAQALQLRGYLLLFDQLMANFTADLAALPDLFAADSAPARSYASQTLDAETVPDLERLYPEDPATALEERVARYDDFVDRKGRVLDYLLALYGEEPGRHPRRELGDDATRAEEERASLDDKIAFLEEVTTLGRDRGAGAAYGLGSGADPGEARGAGTGYGTRRASAASGLQRRVGHLLGLRGPGPVTPATPFDGDRRRGLPDDDTHDGAATDGAPPVDDGERLHVVEHLLLRPRGGRDIAPGERAFYAFRVSVVFPAWPARFAEPGFRELAEDAVRGNCPAHVRPTIRWLGREAMETFETLQKEWLEQLDDGGDLEALDEASRRLAELLDDEARSGSG